MRTASDARDCVHSVSGDARQCRADLLCGVDDTGAARILPHVI